MNYGMNVEKILILLVTVAFLAAAGEDVRALDGGSSTPFGAHALSGVDPVGTCFKCHVPHGGRGAETWFYRLPHVSDFKGIKVLCNSCHYVGNTMGALSGLNTVFNKGAYMNHVMHDWADTEGPTVPSYDEVTFPLNTSDQEGERKDMPWNSDDPDGDTDNKGFNCSSCHNVHSQPWGGYSQKREDLPPLTDGNGDYLRIDATLVTQPGTGLSEDGDLGPSGKRYGFCLQCHEGMETSADGTGSVRHCSRCHNPHMGWTVPTGDPSVDARAKKILVHGSGVSIINPHRR